MRQSPDECKSPSATIQMQMQKQMARFMIQRGIGHSSLRLSKPRQVNGLVFLVLAEEELQGWDMVHWFTQFGGIVRIHHYRNHHKNEFKGVCEILCFL